LTPFIFPDTVVWSIIHEKQGFWEVYMSLRGLCAVVLAGAAGFVVTGCFVESVDTRSPGSGTEIVKPVRDGDIEVGVCRYAIGKGCFDGHIMNRKVFYIDGQEFFNADDLAPRFAELISIKSEEFQLVEGEKFTLNLLSKVDNTGFIEDFEFDLTGDNAFARRGKVLKNGNFSINDVPQGFYELRVQKPIKFSVTGKVQTLAVDPVLLDTEPTYKVEEITRNYCATLYQDTTIEVVKGKRTQETFNSYKLHVTDNECVTGGNQTAISLRK